MRSGRRTFTMMIRCAVDGFDHAVTDENFASGRHSGRFEAVCGHLVHAEPMTMEPGRLHPACRTVLVTGDATESAESTASTTPSIPAPRQPGTLRRLLKRDRR